MQHALLNLHRPQYCHWFTVPEEEEIEAEALLRDRDVNLWSPGLVVST